MLSTRRFREQLELVVRSAGVRAATVYAPTGWAPESPSLLVHAGGAPPLPELASIDAAEAFSRATRESAREAPADGGPLIQSDAPGGVLVPVPLLTTLWAGGAVASTERVDAQPRRRRADTHGSHAVAGWIGLRLAHAGDDASTTPIPPGVELAHALASTIVSLYALLTDPLTGLPGRNELYGALRDGLSRARRRHLPCSLVLVNPLGLQQVNEQHGRRAGDVVVRELVQSLQLLLRRTDVLMRYGGAIFALPLGNVGSEAAMLVGERVRRHVAGQRFLQESVGLDCAVGVVTCMPAELDGVEPLDLLQRANEALAAARHHDGHPVVLWHDHASGAPASIATDRLFGIFTGRTDKDYRNMGLLWDVLQALSSASGTVDLAHNVVDRLTTVLRVSRAALFLVDDSGPRLVYGREAAGGVSPGVLAASDVSEAERLAIIAAVSTREPRQDTLGEGGARRLVLAVPLVVDARALGALCLVGRPDTLDLDRADLHVLAGVAAQVAVALDREHLAERHRVQAEHERRRLQAEVHGLRTALQQTQLVFEGPAMSELLARTRRVATTETTVLITGESGTGKEVLAQTVHQMSGRRAKPFVIVDCGAIPATLIDSELFGHERGAFTGAQQRSLGRLAQADGGTVFLDEIGELPLDVQSRLLRFVQEKTVSMVGSTKSRAVDVRIIAATNRRLEDEVRAGRFREDLFYRLNVVRLEIPPLRERPEDVRVLAEHFMRSFAAEQHKVITGFADDAWRAMAAHHWPGNIRELQNAVLQAVVLADGDRLRASDLRLPVAGGSLAVPAAPTRGPALGAADAMAGGLVQPGTTSFDEAWAWLSAVLRREVDAVASTRPRPGVPIGRWLAHELVCVAHEHASRVAARAAARIGLAQTTFARRLRQAETDRAVTATPTSWNDVRGALQAVVAAPNLPEGSLADRVEALILEVVLSAVPSPASYAAVLLDLSVPTLKHRLAARAS